MVINKVNEIAFDTEETILIASLASAEECVLLMSSGNVIRCKIKEKSVQALFSVKTNIGYDDGGFDINAHSTIYTLDSIVVIVNDYKRHGFIHYPGKYSSLHLWREDYHADISCYPIALFKNEFGVPHIIYSVAWNHLQIMNLDTRQVLTAAKSLIEENAEERYIEYYEKYKENNKFPWPSPYDYFFAKLILSPDKKKFLSAGWAWGSVDSYRVYDIDHFIKSNRIADIHLGAWEHNERAVCWINDNTVAVAYNPYTEEEENATKDSPCELHFYKLDKEYPDVESKVKLEGLDIVNAYMYYDEKRNRIITFSKQIGIALFSLDGQLLFQNKEFTPDKYYAELNLFLKIESKKISVYEIND